MAHDTHTGGVPYSHRTGSRRAGERGGGRRKLLPLLLALLLAAALAILLISLLGGDDDGGSSEAGRLSAGGAQLLPPPEGGLSTQVGQNASGKDVVVQAVNGNEGFFVGSGTKDRVYVEWGGDVGADEADFQPKEGDRVNLNGPVKAAPEKAERVLNLSPEDAALVSRQGAYVNAEEVTPAG